MIPHNKIKAQRKLNPIEYSAKSALELLEVGQRMAINIDIAGLKDRKTIKHVQHAVAQFKAYNKAMKFTSRVAPTLGGWHIFVTREA